MARTQSKIRETAVAAIDPDPYRIQKRYGMARVQETAVAASRIQSPGDGTSSTSTIRTFACRTPREIIKAVSETAAPSGGDRTSHDDLKVAIEEQFKSACFLTFAPHSQHLTMDADTKIQLARLELARCQEQTAAAADSGAE